MWNKLLDIMLERLFRSGTFRLRLPDGSLRTYGDNTGTPVTVSLKDTNLVRQIVLNADMAVGEAYTDGRLTIEDDDLRGFMALAVQNIGGGDVAWWQAPAERTRKVLKRWRQLAPAAKARRNVAHHYDLSGELYELFLDEDRQYSCAYFSDPNMSLEAAQAAKKAHIAGKLLLEPGMHVLDIGCGWGGMALTLARDYGVRVTGVTLSEEQHKIATERVRAAGLEDRVAFRLQDYRHVPETFDRVVSVGMFEHVGVPHFREYFQSVADRLSPDGVALIHTIGRTAKPSATSKWIDKYIFPGGYVPSMSEMSAAFEQELYLTDIEVWRLHYAETLKAWYDRFTANEARAREIYDARFCRMWRYYLVACEMTFRHARQAVFQVQLAHRQDAVPLTRDYLYPAEEEGLRHAAE